MPAAALAVGQHIVERWWVCTAPTTAPLVGVSAHRHPDVGCGHHHNMVCQGRLSKVTQLPESTLGEPRNVCRCVQDLRKVQGPTLH